MKKLTTKEMKEILVRSGLKSEANDYGFLLNLLSLGLDALADEFERKKMPYTARSEREHAHNIFLALAERGFFDKYR